MDDFTNRDRASAIIRPDDGDFCVSSLYLDIEFKPDNTTLVGEWLDLGAVGLDPETGDFVEYIDTESQECYKIFW